MTQKALSSASKAFFLLFLLCSSYSGWAQFGYNAKKNNLDNFLKTQWWLGIRVGTNFSQPVSKTSYTSINPIDYAVDSLDKDYEIFSLPGINIGLDITFYHQGFSFGFQPAFKQMRYAYSSNLAWTGDTEVERYETRYNVKQKLDYIEIPLSLKYEIIQNGKIRPFAMAGFHYSFRLGAEKETTIINTDYITGAARNTNAGRITSDLKDQFQNYFGVLAGVGSAFDFLEIRTVLEITYALALNSLANTDSRFDSTELTSLGEVNDEINLNSLGVSLSFVFPLRFIDTTFQSR